MGAPEHEGPGLTFWKHLWEWHGLREPQLHHALRQTPDDLTDLACSGEAGLNRKDTRSGTEAI